MKKTQLFNLFILIGACIATVSCNKKESATAAAAGTSESDYTQYVDPYIGSAGHGHVFVGANVPFGAVQLGPSQIDGGWDWCSAYNYSQNVIIGFTHTHLSGTGCADLNDILLLPFTGKPMLKHLNFEQLKDPKNVNPNELSTTYGSTFSHKNEVVKPGYYSVLLDRYNVKAELTASERVGFHQYTFNSNEAPQFLLDLTDGVGGDKAVKTEITKIDGKTIVGCRNSKGWAPDQRLYFAMEFSDDIDNIITYDSTNVVTAAGSKAMNIKAVINFKKVKDNKIQVKVGLSPVSTENAVANIKAEIPDWNFDKVAKTADEKWNKELHKIDINADADTKKVFYTSLYHTMFAPSIFNDANGDYLGTDKKVYKNAGFTNYTTFSLWDTYRALHPLFTIIESDKVNDIVKSFLAIYQQQGRLPVWHLMGSETDCMNGNHSIAVIADAYFKGYRDYDVELAYQAMKTTADFDKKGVKYLKKLQYIPADLEGESVANALEYAIDDWCIAKMAKDLGKTADYEYFSKRAELYKQYFDKNTGFMRGKLANGKWREPFDPLYSNHRRDDYVEGNAWQYIWLVPQDPYGLINLFGGDKNFTDKLDGLFSNKGKITGKEISADISGLIGQYAHGNEPGHHTSYLYAFAGQPWKTAKIVRQVFDTFYTTKADGICGNEDVGQMSAWYILSSMGFYGVNPANGIYVMGSPAVNEATINLKDGVSFKVIAQDNSKTNIYIQKVEYNGKPYTKSYITHDMIVKGGELKMYMGSKPSPTFGVAKADRPL